MYRSNHPRVSYHKLTDSHRIRATYRKEQYSFSVEKDFDIAMRVSWLSGDILSGNSTFPELTSPPLTREQATRVLDRCDKIISKTYPMPTYIRNY